MGLYVRTAPAGVGIDDLSYIDQSYRREPDGIWERTHGLGAIPRETNNTDPVVLRFWQRLSSRDGQTGDRYMRAWRYTAARVPDTVVARFCRETGLPRVIAKRLYAAVVLLRNRQTVTQMRARIRGNLGNSPADRKAAVRAARQIQKYGRYGAEHRVDR